MLVQVQLLLLFQFLRCFAQVTDDVLTKTNDDAVSELEAKLALAGMRV